MYFIAISLAMGLFLTPCRSLAADYYVQISGGNDANTGDSWGAGHALQTITKALQLVASNPATGENTIHVAAGIYSENLQIINGMHDLTLVGGYPQSGGNTADPAINITAIDGATTAGRPLTIEGATNVRVEGFEIRNGNIADIGGGVFIDNSTNVQIVNTSIHHNKTTKEWGGGIAVKSSSITLANNGIRYNSTDFEGGGISLQFITSGSLTGNKIEHNHATHTGGGIYCNSTGNSAALEIANNDITSNDADMGGGLAVSKSDGVKIHDNRILSNTAIHNGAGILYEESTNCTIASNYIGSNKATNWGGGLNINTSSDIKDIKNNIIAKNSAGTGGGGAAVDNQSHATFINNTFAFNQMTDPTSHPEICHGISFTGNSNGEVQNCILWDGDTNAVAGSKEICTLTNGTNTVNATYSDIWPGLPKTGIFAGTGNKDDAPLFNPAPHAKITDDYYLDGKSPCIDTGTGIGAGVPTQDFEGTPRPQQKGMDMGAFEYTSYPDLTGEWKMLGQKGIIPILTGKFVVKNLIPRHPVKPFQVAFYFSRDGVKLAPSPFKVVTVHLIELPEKMIEFKYKSNIGSVKPKYVIAFINWKHQVKEENENNNQIAELVK